MLEKVYDGAGRLNGFSWLAVLLGYPILGIWYWCVDQTHVQRVLAAKDLKAAQKWTAICRLSQDQSVFLMVLPGVVGNILWRKGAFALPALPGSGLPGLG